MDLVTVNAILSTYSLLIPKYFSLIRDVPFYFRCANTIYMEEKWTPQLIMPLRLLRLATQSLHCP